MNLIKTRPWYSHSTAEAQAAQALYGQGMPSLYDDRTEIQSRLNQVKSVK